MERKKLMSDKRHFNDGCIEYSVTSKIPVGFFLEGWDDGYVAFSNKEFRLEEIKKKLDGKSLSAIENINVKGVIEGAEGFLMEIGLWRKSDDGSYAEISIEREDVGFLVQEWKLSKVKSDRSMLCYYREVETKPRGNSIFKDSSIKSIEVIVPENRLHFFLTVKGDNNGNWKG